jgi:hypothetical protein
MDQSPSASLAYLHQRLDELSQSLAAAAAPAMGRFDELRGYSTFAIGDESGADTPPLPPGGGRGEGNAPQTPSLPSFHFTGEDPGDSGIAGDSSSPAPSAGERGGAGPTARFESLDGLYQRIAASAAGGGSDQQASQANLETARNTSLILQALEAQNRLLESGAGKQQQQQILWQ